MDEADIEEAASLGRTALTLRAMLCHLLNAAGFFIFALSTLGLAFLAGGLAPSIGAPPEAASAVGAVLGVALGFALFGLLLREARHRARCVEASRSPRLLLAGLLTLGGIAGMWLCMAAGRPDTAWYPGVGLWLSLGYSLRPSPYFRPQLMAGLLIMATTPLAALTGVEAGVGLISLIYLLTGYRELLRAVRAGR